MSEHKPGNPFQSQQTESETTISSPLESINFSDYEGSNRLENKVALIIGGDSGIGRAVAVAFAKEGADVVIAYQEEDEDAKETKRLIQGIGKHCLIVPGDVGEESFCRSLVDITMGNFGKLDVLVNEAAQHHQLNTEAIDTSIERSDSKQLEKDFRLNIFNTVKAALPHMTEGAHIINTTSVRPSSSQEHLRDYSATKGAIVAYTKCLARQLAKAGIQVNAVAMAPDRTELEPAPSAEEASNVSPDCLAQSDDIAPYVFLASNDSSYMTGQVLSPKCRVNF